MQKLSDLLLADLRLSLLLIGLAFIAVLVIWELVQRRRARHADDEHELGAHGQPRDQIRPYRDPLLDVEPEGEAPPVDIETQEEPTLALPEMSVRDRLVAPPIIDLSVAVDASGRARGLPVVDAVTLSDTDLDVSVGVGMKPATSGVTPSQDDSSRASRVAWPSEGERRIVGLRIVARPGERFTGASLRQALQGEGFEHGEMQIFHRAATDGHVLLSAASLTRPGDFDLATMDSNLYLGLNLFAILPGPLAARETVDRLLATGHTLAKRLRGELQGSQGEPLTEPRLAEMRREAARGEG